MGRFSKRNPSCRNEDQACRGDNEGEHRQVPVRLLFKPFISSVLLVVCSTGVVTQGNPSLDVIVGRHRC